MKKRILLLFVLTMGFLVSCKDEKTVTEPNKQVQVVLSGTITKDDSFQLFFKEEDKLDIPFAEGNSVWVDVKASDKPQTITFNLPENVLPNYLRLDVGKSDKHGTMTITSLNVSYLDKKVTMNSNTFFDTYFIANKCITVEDKGAGLIKLHKDEAGTYDPIFNSGENLKYELQKMYR
jgi:hypothetical protein